MATPTLLRCKLRFRASAQLCTDCYSFCAHLTRMTIELNKSINHINQYQQLLCSRKALLVLLVLLLLLLLLLLLSLEKQRLSTQDGQKPG